MTEPTLVVNAMLCDHAQVSPPDSGKLFISGANINVFNFPSGAPAPYIVNFAVAGIVHVPWLATNQPHRLTLHVLTEDGQVPQVPDGIQLPETGIGGEMQFNVGRPPALPGGDEQMVPFAFNIQGLPLMRAGKYIAELSIDGTPATRLAFRLVQHQAPVSFGPSTPGPIR